LSELRAVFGGPRSNNGRPRDQQRLLLDSVREEKLPEAQIAELSDGATVPQDIELEPLPSSVVTQIPTIERYRVLVVPDNRVVLVDPDTRAVVDVIR
jgi:hypothetical protein